MKRVGLLLANLNLGLSVPLWKGIAKEVLDAADGPLFLFPGGRLDYHEGNEYLANSIYSLANSSSLDSLVIWSSSLGGTVSMEETVRFVQDKASELPVVSMGMKVPGVPSVDFDAYSGMKAGISHLIREHGERRIAFLRGPDLHRSAEARYSAYKDALKDARLDFDPRLVSSPSAWDSGYDALKELVRGRHLVPGKDFTALVAASDQILSKACALLSEMGVRIPEDVRALGFNDSRDDLVLLGTRTTTVRMPVAELAKAAYESLSGHGTSDINLPTRLVVRESCGCGSCFSRISTRDDFLKEMRGLLPPRAVALLMDVLGLLAGPVPDKGRLERAVEAFVAESPDFDILTDAIPAYSRIEGLSISPETLESLYKVLLREEERMAAGERISSLKALRLLNDFKTELISAHTLEEALSVMASALPEVGISKCFLFLYAGYSDVVLKGGFSGARAYTRSERFRRGRIAPESLDAELSEGVFVVEPLYQGSEELGYLVLSAGSVEGYLLEDIRTAVSYAVRGARLFEENSSAKEEAERKEREVREFYGKLSKGVMRPLRDISEIIVAGGELDTTALMGHIQSAEQLVELSFAEHVGQVLDLRLCALEELVSLLEEKGMKVERPTELPLMRLDLERVVDAVMSISMTVFPEGDAGCSLAVTRWGLSIRLVGTVPEMLESDLLLVPRKIVMLHSGTFNIDDSGVTMTLPYPVLSGGTGIPGNGPVCYISPDKPQPSSLGALGDVVVKGVSDLSSLSSLAPSVISWRGGSRIPIRLLCSHRSTRDLPFLCFGPTDEEKDLLASSIPQAGIALCSFCRLPSELSFLSEYGLLVRISAIRDLERLSMDPALILLDRIDLKLISQIRERKRFSKVPFLIVRESFTLKDAEALSEVPDLLMVNVSTLEVPDFQERLVRVIGGSPMLPSLTGAIVKRAIAYLNINATGSVSRWKLADFVNISEDYLTRIFHKEIGLSPWEYLSRYRIQLAMDLLTRTGRSISEIASSLGFQDQAYFCRVFKKIKGFPPGKLRQRKAEDQRPILNRTERPSTGLEP